MPGTFLNFPFDEELFLMQWQAAQDPVKLAMLNSGAIQNNNEIAGLISNGSNLYTIPFYNVLGGDPDNYDGNTNITTDEPSGGYQSGVVFGRAHGWKDRDFVHDFNSGANPMQAIASQVAKYWDKQRQSIVLKILSGVFSTTDNTGGYLAAWNQHKTSIAASSGTVGEANKLGATTMGDAMQAALGDQASSFAMAWMHSKVAQNLANLQLLQFRKYTDPMGIERQLNIADYNGITVIVDDGVPVANSTISGEKEYTTYVMGVGSLQHATAPVEVPVETARESKTNGGYNELITRMRETYHPNGFVYKLPTGCKSPTDAQLSAAANWGIAVDPKLIPMARIVSNG